MPEASLNRLKHLDSGEQDNTAHPGAQARKTHHLSADPRSFGSPFDLNQHAPAQFHQYLPRALVRVMPSPKAFEPYRTDR
jgi:hypothetical protein